MKEIYLKFSMLLLCLVVGLSSWAETATLTFTKACGGSGTDTRNNSWIVTSDAEESSYESTRGIHYGTSKVDVSYLTLKTSGISGTITKVVVNASGASKTSAVLNVKVGDSAFGTQTSLTSDATDYTFEGSATGAIEVKLSQTSAKKALYLKSITITYSTGGGTLTASAPTLPASSTFTSDSYDVTITNNETGATVYYTTDGNVPTTSSTSFTGESTTISINATTTVKAMAVISGKSNSSVATATYTKEASIANTAETAYTTAQAIALIDASSSQLATTDVYVKGTVSKVDKYDATYKSITYWLDNNAFEIYSGLAKEGEEFSSINDIAVGAQVVVKGIIKKFNSTYEMDKNNHIISYTAPAVEKQNATITLGTYQKTLTKGDGDEYTVVYNGDATLEVTSSDETVAEAVIVDGSVMVEAKKAGTTTITISAAETDNYTAVSKSYTLTVTDPAPAAKLPFSFDSGKGDIDKTTGMSHTGLGSDYTSSPKLKFDSAGDNVVINYEGTAVYVAYKLKGNSIGGTYQFDVQESADGKTYTTIHSHTSLSSTDPSFCIDKLKKDSRFVKFVYTTRESGNVGLGDITISNEKADVGLAFDRSTYRFFANVEDKAVSAISSKGSTGAITYALTNGDENAFLIDENTGNIVCKTAGTYTVTATIAETDVYKSGTATCTVQIKEPIVANSIIIAEADGKYFAMTNTYNDKDYIESVQILGKAGDKYVVESEDALNAIKYCTTTTEGKTTIVAMNGQYLQATAAKAVSFTDDEYQWTNAEGVLTAADNSHGTLQYNTGNPRFTTYGSKVGQYAAIVSLDDVVLGTALAISGKEWATFYSDKAYIMSANAKGVTVSANDSGNLTLTEKYSSGAVVPKNTPLLINAPEGTYNIIYTSEEGSPAGDNLLRGQLKAGMIEAETEGDYYYYKLTTGSQEPNIGKLGFYWGATNGGVFKINNDNRAYLVLPKSAGDVKALTFEDMATAITSVAVPESENAPMFNISGQRITTPVRGQMYIKNGKKYLAK